MKTSLSDFKTLYYTNQITILDCKLLLYKGYNKPFITYIKYQYKVGINRTIFNERLVVDRSFFYKLSKDLKIEVNEFGEWEALYPCESKYINFNFMYYRNEKQLLNGFYLNQLISSNQISRKNCRHLYNMLRFNNYDLIEYTDHNNLIQLTWRR
jgi:hypothetical protein